jgi:hypothetical protein
MRAVASSADTVGVMSFPDPLASAPQTVGTGCRARLSLNGAPTPCVLLLSWSYIDPHWVRFSSRTTACYREYGFSVPRRGLASLVNRSRRELALDTGEVLERSSARPHMLTATLPTEEGDVVGLVFPPAPVALLLEASRPLQQEAARLCDARLISDIESYISR